MTMHKRNTEAAARETLRPLNCTGSLHISVKCYAKALERGALRRLKGTSFILKFQKDPARSSIFVAFHPRKKKTILFSSPSRSWGVGSRNFRNSDSCSKSARAQFSRLQQHFTTMCTESRLTALPHENAKVMPELQLPPRGVRENSSIRSSGRREGDRVSEASL